MENQTIGCVFLNKTKGNGAESAWHQELLKCDDTQEMLPLGPILVDLLYTCVVNTFHDLLESSTTPADARGLIVAFLEQAAPRGDRVSRPGVYETAQCSTPLDLTKAVTTAFPLTKRHGVEHFAGGTSWKVQMLPTSAHATVLADVIAHAPYHILPKCIITTGPEGHGVRREVPCISAAKAYYSKPKPKQRS